LMSILLKKSNNKSIGLFVLIMMNIIAIDSLRSLTAGVEYGFSLVFFYLLAGFLFFIPTILVTAELATGWPNTGGVYIWVREAFGPRYGFLSIWLQWIYNVVWYPTIFAFVAGVFAYLINPALVDNKLFMLSVILSFYWIMTLINCFGIKVSSIVSVVGAIAGTIFPMLLISILGFVWLYLSKPTQIDFSFSDFIPDVSSYNDLAFLTNILFGLMGIELSAVHAGDVSDPKKTFPLSLFYSSVIIFVTLIFSCLSISIVIPVQDLNLVSGFIQAFTVFFNTYNMGWFIPIIIFLVVVGSMGNASTWIMGSARGLLVASADTKISKLISKQNKNNAIIILILDTGPRYYFGKFIFNQNSYSTLFLQTFNTIKEGEPFSTTKLLKYQHELNSSRYFKNVTINPDLDKIKNKKVTTNVDVILPKAKQYSIGAGYGTFTGPRLTLAVNRKRIGRFGQSANIQAKISSVLTGVTGRYYIPGKNPLTDQYNISLNIQRFLPKNGESLSQSLSVSYSQQRNKLHDTISLYGLNETYKEKNSKQRNSHLLYPSYNIAYKSTDNILNPKSGQSFNIVLRGSSNYIASTTSFFQAQVKGKIIFSPTKNSKILSRADFGYTVVNNLKELPLTLNFFAGGLNSLRGYPYASIGPGKYLRTASVELQHKIIGSFSGAIFYDIGNASDHFNDDIKKGSGIGIIYNSIMGPIKLYAGHAISEKGKPMSLEFSIGPDF
ncbi:amino acid permease, partial [Gammaproteobacteria bacterium]|nr:amino acid permease [Gammaproteobacteria bacterium]